MAKKTNSQVTNENFSMPEEFIITKKLECLSLACKMLSDLSLRQIGLEEVPDFIKQLSYLKGLDLRGNNLISLPVWVGGLPVINGIWAQGNSKLKTPPAEIVSKHPQDVGSYMKLLFANAVQCFATKLMVVGLGGVGKTALFHALKTGRAATTLKSTDGINVDKWKLKNIKFSMWDFAGQTVYYNVQ